MVLSTYTRRRSIMVKRPATHSKVLVAAEVALVGLLCCIVLSSSSTAQPGSIVESSSQKAKKLQKQQDKLVREVPPEGAEPVASNRILAQVGTPVACTGFDFEGGALQGFTVESTFATPQALWHVTNGLCRAFLTGHST